MQMGAELFQQFSACAEKQIAGLASIETTYVTRAWVARRA
jgi:hypothetical protein